MKDGHKCRIASHPEYREWVEGYGIEYASVGGDPAELMRSVHVQTKKLCERLTACLSICVENGMFTVSFLREGVAKFRGWLDELLTSSWSACQGCDLLIESPSTMAGCHIAEALQIPYFKAFTMRECNLCPPCSILYSYHSLDENTRLSTRFRCAGSPDGWWLQLYGERSCRI